MSIISPQPPRTGSTAKKAVAAPAQENAQGMSQPMDPMNSWAMWRRGADWPTVVWITVVHASALAAPFYFSWQGFTAFVLLYIATGMFGICMGYHRLLTHGSFQTYRPIRWLLAFLGGLSGEGSALTWVANHRKHHKFSDKAGDPHSPRHGKWWAHIFWFMPNLGQKWRKEVLERYAPDMMKDRVMVWLDRMFLPSQFAMGAVLYAIGYYGTALGMGGENAVYYGCSMFFWGLALRMVYVMHVTWLINSATHLWGYRNYETTDDSKNLWWVALLSFGEGWHNNHHAYQRVAAQGHKWWELDTTNWAILAMEKLGLAWNVVRVRDIPDGTRPA
ncbi:acyl-CoA desaturase [Botrimarina hoheduenensis]|uniref:Fatty acid desaturase n=1 Tax=Botrimarina hoheduenensis TaxID=2528000 RepID=A0A5C5WE32_9BACT|nr:acyl-CoA desaturase [Botrimarina hoheduenensis]TWT48305.1 Fatty acid desaturase [Botrimarina hoheduenensis]